MPKSHDKTAAMREMRSSGATYEEIARKYSITAPAVHRRLNPTSSERRKRNRRILQLHRSGANALDIAKDIGCAEADVAKYLALVQPKLQSRERITINDRAFENIATNGEAQYVLGLIIADGHCNRAQFSISMVDKEAVEAVRDLLAPTKQLVCRKYSEKNPNHSDQWALVLSSKGLRPALNAVGVFEDKVTTACAPPGIEKKGHFWRGLIDGDGCINIDATGKTHVGQVILVSSAPKLIEQFQQFVRRVAGPAAKITVSEKRRSTTKDARGRPRPTTWQVVVTRAAARAVCAALYIGAGRAIKRKQRTALKIVELPLFIEETRKKKLRAQAVKAASAKN